MFREPTAEELAQTLEMDVEEVTNTLRVGTRHVSMDAPFNEGESNSLLDVLENDSAKRADEDLVYYDSLKYETATQ